MNSPHPLRNAAPVSDEVIETQRTLLMLAWVWFYACAIHSAGFFMPGRSRLFAWPFVLVGGGLFYSLWHEEIWQTVSPHCFMAGTFGGLHLAFGIYLYFTEQRKRTA